MAGSESDPEPPSADLATKREAFERTIRLVSSARLRDAAISPGPAGAPPEPGGEAGWATYEAPQPDTPVATSRE